MGQTLRGQVPNEIGFVLMALRSAQLFPLAFAFAKPVFTRSTVISRSSCATAPNTVTTILPVGELRSIFSDRLMKPTPIEFNSSSVRRRWLVERDRRDKE
ncbi:unnamed protein product [Sphagnum balticum]